MQDLSGSGASLQAQGQSLSPHLRQGYDYSIPVAGAGATTDPAPGVRPGCKDLSGSGFLLVGFCGFLWHLLISRHRPSGPNLRGDRVPRHRRSGLRLGLGAKAARGLRRRNGSDGCEAAAAWANGPKKGRRRRGARNPRGFFGPASVGRATSHEGPPTEAYMGPVAAIEQNRQQPASCVCCGSMGGHRHSFSKLNTNYHQFAMQGFGWCWHAPSHLELRGLADPAKQGPPYNRSGGETQLSKLCFSAASVIGGPLLCRISKPSQLEVRSRVPPPAKTPQGNLVFIESETMPVTLSLACTAGPSSQSCSRAPKKSFRQLRRRRGAGNPRACALLMPAASFRPASAGRATRTSAEKHWF